MKIIQPTTFEGVVLPDGWSVSRGDSRPHIAVIHAPRLGFVTLDFNMRGFRSGMTSIGGLASIGTYSGLAWRQKLVADAVRWLEELDGTPP